MAVSSLLLLRAVGRRDVCSSDEGSFFDLGRRRTPSGLFSARGDGFPPGRGWGRIRHEETPEEMAVCV